jgi:formylglycine-generating enzyme required for sulfatase activity
MVKRTICISVLVLILLRVFVLVFFCIPKGTRGAVFDTGSIDPSLPVAEIVTDDKAEEVEEAEAAKVPPPVQAAEPSVHQAPAPIRQIPANMIFVDGGSFRMGSNSDFDDERPIHTVTVSSFYMGKYEVTQEEWTAVMGTDPGNFKGEDLPVEMVSWFDAVEYCNTLSIKEGLRPAYSGSGDNIVCDFTASGYRLPTEAEWEYAARGGNKNNLSYEYSGSNQPGAVGWYYSNSENRTHPVGSKSPNILGLYDMSGNVYEWCWDWYGIYSSDSQTDPRGPAIPLSADDPRVARGGSWENGARYLRSAYRGGKDPSNRINALGFRVVFVVPTVL